MNTFDENEDHYTPEELAAMDRVQRESETHQWDNVDPWEKLESIIGEADEAKGWLEQAQSNLIDAHGAADALKLTDFAEGLDLLRLALGQAIAAVSAIQPNEYLYAQLKSYQEEESRREDQADAQSF